MPAGARVVRDAQASLACAQMLFSRSNAGGLPRFWFQAAIPIGMMALLSLQGCSFIFAIPPPKKAAQGRTHTACSGPALPIVDGVLLGSIVTGTLIQLALADASGSPYQAAQSESTRNTVLLVDVALAAFFVGSTVYGANVASRCNAYLRNKDQIERSERELRQARRADMPTASPEDDSDSEPEAASPSGGAGFKFGESLQEVAANCILHQGKWSIEPHGAACTWMRGQNLVRVGLDFCEAKLMDVRPKSLCRVALETSPQTDDGRAWGKLVNSLGSQLRQRLGPPDQRRTRYPEACKPSDKFYQCLLEGKVSFRQAWEWDDGRTVTLTLGAGSAPSKPSVLVVFATADYAPIAPGTVPTASAVVGAPPQASAPTPPPPTTSTPSVQKFGDAPAPAGR